MDGHGGHANNANNGMTTSMPGGMPTNHTMSSTTMNHMMHMSSTSGTHMHPGGDPNDTDLTCRGDMMMYFHTGKCEYVLFEHLRTSNVGQMVGACVAIFVLAILYEGLKVFRENLLRRALSANKYTMKGSNSSSQDAIVIGSKQPTVHMLSWIHFVQTLLHMLQVFISYCLMLVFMTYNAWLCLAVIVGAGIGYFFFGWTKSIVVDMNEHCH